MKKLSMFLLALVIFTSCEKNDEAKVESSTAQSGKVVCKIGDQSFAHNGSGYILENNYSFVKAENGSEQLSIDFFGLRDGDYTIASSGKVAGTAKITFYPDNKTKISWVSKSGTFKVTKFQSTGGFKASGTFTATLEKFNDKTATGETIEVKDGSFTDIVLFDVR